MHLQLLTLCSPLFKASTASGNLSKLLHLKLFTQYFGNLIFQKKKSYWPKEISLWQIKLKYVAHCHLIMNHKGLKVIIIELKNKKMCNLHASAQIFE